MIQYCACNASYTVKIKAGISSYPRSRDGRYQASSLINLPAFMTILDSEGYVTSRENTRMPEVDEGKRIGEMHAELTGISSIQVDIPPLPLLQGGRVVGTDGSVPSRLKLESSERKDFQEKIEFLERELLVRDSECQGLNILVESNSKAISYMKRNHAYELRLFQKALLSIQHKDRKSGKADTALLEQATKAAIDRDALLKDKDRLEKDLFEFKLRMRDVLVDPRSKRPGTCKTQSACTSPLSPDVYLPRTLKRNGTHRVESFLGMNVPGVVAETRSVMTAETSTTEATESVASQASDNPEAPASSDTGLMDPTGLLKHRNYRSHVLSIVDDIVAEAILVTAKSSSGSYEGPFAP